MNDAHDISRLDLNLLVVFDALLRERSVTRAGQTLGITQSAMSHSLARLRVFFDDALFIKSYRGVTPTAKAEALAPDILAIIDSIRNRVLSQAQFDASQAKRTFSLCVTDMGELVFIPPLLSRLKEVAPHCSIHTLQVPPHNMEATLASGEADLVLGSVMNAPEGLYQQELFMHPFVTIASVKNKEIGDTLSLEQFCSMPHVAVMLAGRSLRAYDSVIEDAGIKRHIAFTTPHFLFVPLLLDQHPEFLATVPQSLGTVFARHNLVKVFEPPVALPKFSLRQYWHPRFHQDRAIVWLRGLVKETFSELPEGMR
ncbi:LysR family transcriptional regulator [Eoetvoesiella caeni]|uniref:LysR family transcriptional regulator n=1 Tax=Eoetvoesiella caeni TaxID=645616 RepID=A0A366HHU9_9BURK|nr:LysR family transcriptional regulator [Eoetvoesiella caeni]MCI2808273.1 LysR family transcriptional regulator [Eoetvoesiella caeni]NYT53724.1 LysR family transcriptional regulator [Eoetvoesiella caeni]RBP42198.1 LysR family transcriptional regulator [Eoetvoesiella caeni]